VRWRRASTSFLPIRAHTIALTSAITRSAALPSVRSALRGERERNRQEAQPSRAGRRRLRRSSDRPSGCRTGWLAGAASAVLATNLVRTRRSGASAVKRHADSRDRAHRVRRLRRRGRLSRAAVESAAGCPRAWCGRASL